MTDTNNPHERARAILQELQRDPELAFAFRDLCALRAREGERPAPMEPPAPAVADVAGAIKSLRSAQAAAILKGGFLERIARVDALAAARAVANRYARGEFPVEEDVATAIRDPGLPETAATRAALAAAQWSARASVGRRGCVYILGGERGRGKTVAACRAVLAVCERARFTTAAAVADTPKNGWPENRDRWSRWSDADGLVVDALGEESNGHDVSLVTDLLMARYSAGALTVCTTNLTSDQVKAVYFSTETGKSLFHRLAFVQGRVERTAQGAAAGADGLRWYEPVAGQNLRDFSERRKIRAAG